MFAAGMRSLLQTLRAEQLCRRVDERFHRWDLGSAGTPFHRKGNGDYRSELASALQAVTAYLKLFALTPEVALVRLDGQYGDVVAIAQRALGRRVSGHTGERISSPRTSSDPGRVGSPTSSECDQSEQR